jgi:YfiR/HmsC-like
MMAAGQRRGEAGSTTNRPHSSMYMLFCMVTCCLVFGTSASANAQTGNNTEYRVKLGFLYNFAEFVQWPSDAFRSPSAPFVICVAGRDPFDRAIEQELRSRTIGGHSVDIKTLKPADDPKACHMIFVRAGDKQAAASILASLRGSSTLTVGETQGFVDLGGVITLVLEDKRLRFEINLDAARQTRLTLSSKLLALAKIVGPERNH